MGHSTDIMDTMFPDPSNRFRLLEENTCFNPTEETVEMVQKDFEFLVESTESEDIDQTSRKRVCRKFNIFIKLENVD